MKKIVVCILIIIFLVGCTEIQPESQQNQKEVEVNNMELRSSEFEHNGKIPNKFTCDGENINPYLTISNVPENSKSLVLIMDDHDIPQEIKEARGIEVFDHWVLFNIPPTTITINENKIITNSIQGKNSRSENRYTGPCPPPQYEPKEHRYFFKLYALDVVLDLKESSTKEEVEKAMEGHIIEKTELVGKYQRI